MFDTSPMTDDQKLLESIKVLGVQIQALHQQALDRATPVVARILRQRTPDVQLIEYTLDQLLGVCSTPAAVELYRRLCRHYWDIDPDAAASYVLAYRDMWDADEVLTQDEAP